MRYSDRHVALFTSALYQLSIEAKSKLPIVDFEAASDGFRWKSGDFRYRLVLMNYRLLLRSYNVNSSTECYEVAYDDCHGVYDKVDYLKNRLSALLKQLDTLHTHNKEEKT